MDPTTFFKQFAVQVRDYAKEFGTACDLPGCTALTLGFRCEKCAKRLCVAHAYWNYLSGVRVVPYCPYCVLQQNPDLFSDSDEDDSA